MAVVATDFPLFPRAPRSLRVPLVFALAVLAIVAMLAFWLRASQASHLSLKVDLSGQSHVSRQAIAEAVKPYLDAGFFSVDLGAIQKAVEALPWVAGAEVQRRWPGSVKIQVHERYPVARWGKGSLLDGHGAVFASAGETQPAGLPGLHGPRGSQQELLGAYKQMQALLVSTPYRLKDLWINKRGAWQARLNPDIELRLGRNHVMQRMSRFAGLVVNALGPRLKQAAYVDLRYSNGFAVGWKHKQEDG
jgi:cell division protein FtsQ